MKGTCKEHFKFSSSVFTAAALFVVAAATPVSAQTPMNKFTSDKGVTVVQKGYISTAPSPVRCAGEDVFTIRADAGGFTAEERSIIIERNLNNALIGSKDRSPLAVEIVVINHLPVIRLGGKHVLTIDTNLAALHNTTCTALADEWAGNLKHALSDSAKVENYVAQLSGDYLYSPYSPPFRRAQWKQARLNHAANEVRPELPVDFVSSASVRDDGFTAMLNRDPDGAEIQFRKALAMEPENQRAHYGLGTALLKQGRVEEAIVHLQEARWLDHDDAQVHLALGEAYESKGLDKMALTRYREASLLQPENPEPVLFIADMREIRDDIGKSALELTEAMKNCPNSAYINLRRKDQIGWRLTKPY